MNVRNQMLNNPPPQVLDIEDDNLRKKFIRDILTDSKSSREVINVSAPPPTAQVNAYPKGLYPNSITEKFVMVKLLRYLLPILITKIRL